MLPNFNSPFLMWFISIDQHSCFIAPDVTGLPTIPENVSFYVFYSTDMNFTYFGLTVEVFLGREIEYIVTVFVRKKWKN